MSDNKPFDWLEQGNKVHEAIGQKGFGIEYEYVLDEDKAKLISEIVYAVIEYACCDFYGFSGTVRDTDMVLSFRLNDIGNDYGELKDKMASFLRNMREIEFIPEQGYMTVNMTIKDVYQKEN